MTVEPLVLAALAAASFAAGFVDAIAGGGGLLTVPALLSAGLEPRFALGTNKGQSVFGAIASLVAFVRAGKVELRRARWFFPLGFAGSVCGVLLLSRVPNTLLRPLVLVLLLAAGAFVVLRPSLAARDKDLEVTPPRTLAAYALAFLIGGYDGFFGPGTGTFLLVTFASVLRLSLVHASAEAKVVNMASNLAAVLLFASQGRVIWSVALPMAAANWLGATVGARTAVRGGEAIVRRVVVLVVLALVGRLAWQLTHAG